MDTITINHHTIEVKEIDEESGKIRFRFCPIWRNPLDFITPNIQAFQWLTRINQHCSDESKRIGFWAHDTNKPASNGDLKRWIEQGAIRFNDRILTPKSMLDFPLHCVILFPKSDTKRITLL